MSHFMVLVIGDDIEGQLAPYQENNCGTCPEQYLAFVDKTADVEAEWKGLSDEERAGFANIDGLRDIEAFADTALGLSAREVDGVKRFGFMENPNAKWDWFQVGGRWAGHLSLRTGAKADTARKGDIDWTARGATAALRARLDFQRWKAALDQHPDAPRPRPWAEIRAEHEGAIERAREVYAAQPAVATWISLVDAFTCSRVEPVGDFGFDADAYIAKERRLEVAPHAYLHEGKWHERGKMGFFALVRDEKPALAWCEQWERFWESLPDDTRVTVVDCHI